MTATTAASPHRNRWWTRPALQAGLAAFVVALLAQRWSYRHHAVFAFWDAQAHLDIARRMWDSLTPGLQMLGTVWLPVPHLLLLPFTLVDRWWWNGTAGSIVGLAAFVVTIACVRDLLARHVADRRIAWTGTLLVALNPSLLYLQTTAMTEPVLLACLTAAVCALDRWQATASRRALVAAAIAAALAVGSRYDGWFFVLIATPGVAWIAWRAQRLGASITRAWWRETLVFAVPSGVMVAAWLAYNWHDFGDPLAFQRGAWSAQSQQAALAAQGLLPTRGHPLLALGYYLGATVLCAGLALTVTGLAGLLPMLVRWRRHVVPLLLFSALPFNVLALWTGQSVIALPWSHPAGVVNLRYGVMLIPALGVATALVAWELVARHGATVRTTTLACLVVLAAQVIWFGVSWPSHAGALREGLAIRDGDRRQQDASDWLAGHYDGGRVLIDEAVNISPRTRIAMRDRVYRWTWQLGAAALAAPDSTVDWVVVDRRHTPDVVASAIAKRPQFPQHFDRTFDEGGLEIWRRR